MSEWKEYSLSDCCDLIAGYAFKSKDFGDYPVKVIKIADINPPFVSSGSSAGVNIDNYDLKKIEKYIVKKGDYLLAMTGATIGKLGRYISEDNSYLNQRVLKFQAKDNIDSDFLYYVLSGHYFSKYVINHIDSESAQPNISASTIGKYTFIAPSLVEQRNIASILSSLDDKIAVNKKICENLEAQAQALFKHWFVDFEPFKDGNFCANREQNETCFNSAEVQPKITGKACKFVESELGLIPEGWRVGNLFDVASIYDKIRKPLSGKDREYMNKIYPYYGATSCMDYVDSYLFDGIYTLIGEDGSVVKENGLPYMQYVWGKFWVNNHAHILQGKNGFSTEMVHVFLSRYNIKHLVTGAVQAKLSQANMQKILLPIPPKDEINKIRSVIDGLYEKIRNCEEESSRLSTLRDTLLPKLMSGQIKL